MPESKRTQLEIQQEAYAKLVEREAKLKQELKQAKLRLERAQKLHDKREAEEKRRIDAHCKIRLGGIIWREIHSRLPELSIDSVNFDAIDKLFSEGNNGAVLAEYAIRE